MRKIVGPIACVALAIVLAHFNHGCKLSGKLATPEEVNAAYTAETLGCVEKSHTKAESHKCRVEVNHRYGICEGPAPHSVPCD